MIDTAKLLIQLAAEGRVIATEPQWRELWYRGLTKYVSPTEMELSDEGFREASRLYYLTSKEDQ